MSAETVRCTRRWCGATLEERWTLAGKLILVCAPCRTNSLGRCRDCNGSLENRRAMRCNACGRRALLERDRANHAKRYRENEAFRQEQIEYQRERRKRPEVKAATKEWRKLQPKPTRDAADRLFWNAWRKTHPLTRAQMDRRNERARARYAANPKKVLDANRARRADPTTRAIDNLKQTQRDHARRSPRRDRSVAGSIAPVAQDNARRAS